MSEYDDQRETTELPADPGGTAAAPASSQAPPPPPPPPAPAAPGPTPPAANNHTVRAVVAGGIAAAVFGGAGLGVGLLIAPHHDTTAPTAANPFGNITQTSPDGGTYTFTLPQLPGGWQSWVGQRQVPGTTSMQTTRAATSTELAGLVRVHTTLDYGAGEAAGTGMVLTSDGEVVTNHHVVAGATSLEVTVLSTGKTYRASVVGTDATADVAVLQLQDASGLTTVSTNTSGVQVGDKVTAVGDAGGSATTFTAAPGSVSATNQSITAQAEGAGSERLHGLFEITSDVAAGDSGGATYDSDGDVVGMTTAASSGGTEVDGYSIPIATVLSIASDLHNHVAGAAYAYGKPAFLGVAIANGAGIRVAQVYDGTAAANAGITAGDEITAFDGKTVRSATALGRAVKSHQPGDRASVTWTDTTGRPHTATVTLGEGPIA